MSYYSGDYLIYLRKSRADMDAERRGEGETLARHEHTLLELAGRLKLNITDIYREVVSGETIAARPQMQRLLSEVEEGVWAGVLVMEVERLARGDTVDQGIVAQTFKYSGTKIITPAKTYDPENEFDEEYFEFGLFMSRREYKTINRRLQRGRLASVKEGKWVNSTAPYGYRRVKIANDKGYTLRPVPEEADVVRTIFELYTLGKPEEDGTRSRLGVHRIVNYLNSLHIPTSGGGEWTGGTVRDMLRNPAYCGMVRWNWRKSIKRRQEGKVVMIRPRNSSDSPEYLIVKGLHEAIISKETFDLAQEYLRDHPPVSADKSSTILNPLAGLVICGKCGRRMQRRPYRKTQYSPTLLCPYSSCDNVGSDLSMVEGRIIKALSEWADSYTLEWENEEGTAESSLKTQERALHSMEADIANLAKQRDNLHDLLERGIYDTDTFLERSRIVALRLKEAEDDRAAIQKSISDEKERLSNRQSIVPKVRHLVDVYDTLPSAKAKNDMLREVLEKVVYTKEKSGRWGRPDDFEIVLHPRIPRLP